jgi:hypothetical protein
LNRKAIGVRKIAFAKAEAINSVEDIGLAYSVFSQQAIHSRAKLGLECVVVFKLKQLEFMEGNS